MGKHRAPSRTNRVAAGAVVGGAAVVGVVMGAGPAQAQVDDGHYVGQNLIYGVIPTPEYNARVAGNLYHQDFYGLGPESPFAMGVTPTPDGGNIAWGSDPVSHWFNHFEVHKTPTGYYGTQYEYGQIPIGNIILTDTPRRANQPR